MKVNFDALNEGRLQYPHEEKAMKLIITVVKNVFGRELEYIVYPEEAAEHFKTLTGKESINESDKEALSKLGDIQFENYSEKWQSAIDYLNKQESR